MNYREIWIDALVKLIHPVLYNMSQNTLKQTMPLKAHKESEDIQYCTYLEALSRTLLGTTAWFNAKEIDTKEKKLQEYYLDLSIKSIKNAVNPNAEDFAYTKKDGEFLSQILVDTAFLALAFLRAKEVLWDSLDFETKKNVIYYFKETRKILPSSSNWILFSSMVETFLYEIGEDYDIMRIDYGFKQFEQWYVGDGLYSDGQKFRMDYYNSYVIQPFLVDMILRIKYVYRDYNIHLTNVMLRAKRYSEILLRSISSDGSFPSYGRSITYRSGAFHHLANMVLLQRLPENMKQGAVRKAMTKNMEKCFYSENTFDENGWLNIGLYGNQPSLGETYISQGSLYLCTAIFLPLGLDNTSNFWSDNEEDFVTEKLLKGIDVLRDMAL